MGEGKLRALARAMRDDGMYITVRYCKAYPPNHIHDDDSHRRNHCIFKRIKFK
jgi:hypothetical protein